LREGVKRRGKEGVRDLMPTAFGRHRKADLKLSLAPEENRGGNRRATK